MDKPQVAMEDSEPYGCCNLCYTSVSLSPPLFFALLSPSVSPSLSVSLSLSLCLSLSISLLHSISLLLSLLLASSDHGTQSDFWH